MLISVVLACPQLLYRRALRELLSKEDISVAGEASDGREVVQLAANIRPDVAVLDVFMPLLNGLDAGKEILQVSTNTKVVLVSFHMGVSFLRNALAAGVSALVSKAGPAANLEYTVRRVATGSIYLDPFVGSTISAAEPQSDEDGKIGLTARERQVVQLIAECMTTKEIAAVLGISTKTTESHRQRAMARLNLSEIAQLVRYAIRKNLVDVRIPPGNCRNGEEDLWADSLTRAASAF
jgi:two-component system response regulator NreC